MRGGCESKVTEKMRLGPQLSAHTPHTLRPMSSAQMHPTLAPVAGVALVELMLKSGELATRATSAPAAADGAPPAALAREETRAAQARAERTEAPRRHVFPPEDSGKFPFGSSGDYAFPRVVTG